MWHVMFSFLGRGKSTHIWLAEDEEGTGLWGLQGVDHARRNTRDEEENPQHFLLLAGDYFFIWLELLSYYPFKMLQRI